MSDSPPQRVNRFRDRLLNLAVLLCGLLLALLLAEGLVRLTIGNPPRLIDRSDPILGHRYVRSIRAERRVDGRRVPVRINADGFHSPEFGPARRGVTRLLCLGDSFTAATEVPLEETFPQVTAQLLTTPERPVEALSLGMSGYNTAQELLAWRTIGAGLRPDLVVLAFFCGNDVSDNDPELCAGHLPQFALRAGELVPLPFTPKYKRDDGWVRQTALYKFQRDAGNRLVDRLQRRTALPRRYMAFGAPPDAVWQRAWAVTEALLGQVAREVEATGARFLLLILPDQLAVDPVFLARTRAETPALAAATLDVDYPARRLGEWAARNGVASVDLTPAARTAIAAGRALYNVEEPHFNTAGHRLCAETIAAALPSLTESAAVGLPAPRP